jgi:outer membrane protein TolC
LAADLVDRRPETQAAFERLKAADFRRAAAVAAERPQVQLSAVLGAPDAAIVTLLDTRALAWALAGRIGVGVLDGGGARARIRAATAEADIADLAYRKTVLEGWADLRNAAVADAAAGQALAAAEQALARAEAGLRAVQARHAEGAADGLAMAQAQARLEDARDGLREARARAADAHVRRVLAGGGR